MPKIIIIHKLCLVLLISIFGSHWLFSNDKQDSLKSYQTKTVKVLTSKYISNSSFGYASTSLFDRKFIEKSNALQVTDIISKAPGIFINDYGGLGAMKTLSTRGTNGSQTLVMLDGIPISSLQNGSYDFSIFPVSLINEIELVRGGQSSVAGSNSIAGAVNIRLNIPEEKRFTLKTSYGTFDEFNLAAGAFFQMPNSKFAINADFTNCLGNYTFPFTQFGESEKIKRSNASFDNIIVSVANQTLIKSTRLKTNIILRSTGRGVPGAVLQGRIESSRANLIEKELIFTSSVSRNIFQQSLFESSCLIKIGEMKYSDPDMPGKETFGQKNNFYNRDIFWQASLLIPDSSSSFKLSSSLAYSNLRGNMLDPTVSGEVERLNLSLSSFAERGFLIWQAKFETMAALRMDIFSDNSPAFSPMIAFNFQPSPSIPISIKGQLSQNFRMPNFNEMYYLNYGTSNLIAENSLSSNIGISSQIFSRLHIELAYFNIRTENQIIAIPKSPITWSAANIDLVGSNGFEIMADLKLDELYISNIGFSWTLQKAQNLTKNSDYYKKIVLMTPQEMIHSFITFDLSYISLNLNADYNSFRFVQADNDPNNILPANLVFNLSMSAPIPMPIGELNASFQVKNMTNEPYSVIKNYPMPGRQFVLSINYSY